MWQLARRSGTLDDNSCYAYLLLATHFGGTCVVAEADGAVVGFVAAYVPPVKPDVVFVWQIGVDPEFRRAGLGRRLLRCLISLQETRGVRYLEATVTPSNEASRRLFVSFAAELDTDCDESEGFRPEDFGEESHDAERLLRVGPLPEKRGIDGNVR